VNPAPGQRPDPEDGSHTVLNFVIFRLSDFVSATLYLAALPWQRPMTWFGIVAVTGSLRFWNANRPGFRALPLRERKARYTVFTWLHMAALGSAGFFLYLPDNMLMLTLLGLHVFGMATVAAVRLSADYARNAVAVSLIVIPGSLRALAEGALEGRLPLVLMGLAGIFGTLTLVRAARLHEQMLDQQSEQRLRAERAADAMASVGLAKSRFFAAVSHDLRQPVHAIGLYLEPLATLSREAGNQDSERAVEGIRACWKALDGLLSQVLDLTRMDAGVTDACMEPVDLERLVRRLVLQHGAVAEQAGVRLVAMAAPGRFAHADELMLERVMSNLVDNAIKFSPRGGTVAVAVRRGPEGWRLQVRDAGRGMPVEAQGRIFEDFVQLENDARNRNDGYGLGLAISRRFVQLMGGRLVVRSAPGRGTSMTVIVARTEKAPPQKAHSAAGAPGPLASQTHLFPAPAGSFEDILIVEDDALVAEAMRQVLESWGHRVLHVPTGAEALARQAFGGVAICDVRLPVGPSGLQVALQLRELGKKVLLVSGETDTGLRESAALHGLQLLVKPVSAAMLHSALQRAA
jgi:signal transduction histidine kinase/CheY-like chemotaxis protein